MPRKKVGADDCRYGKIDCFAFGLYGKCKACVDTNFREGYCPFYKTSFQRRNEHVAAVRHLEEIGRDDLVEKYNNCKKEYRTWREI